MIFFIRFKHTLSLRTFSSLFLATFSQNCTAGHGFRPDLDFFIRAGVRRYLNSNANNFLIIIYTHVCMCDVHKTSVQHLFVVRSISVPNPFESLLTSILLKESGVKWTVHGRGFLAHTVAPFLAPASLLLCSF